MRDGLDRASGSWTIVVPGSTRKIAFSRDDRYLVTSGTTVRIWEVHTGHELARIPAWGIADFHPHDGRRAVGGKEVGLWPLPRG